MFFGLYEDFFEADAASDFLLLVTEEFLLDLVFEDFDFLSLFLSLSLSLPLFLLFLELSSFSSSSSSSSSKLLLLELLSSNFSLNFSSLARSSSFINSL